MDRDRYFAPPRPKRLRSDRSCPSFSRSADRAGSGAGKGHARDRECRRLRALEIAARVFAKDVEAIPSIEAIGIGGTKTVALALFCPELRGAPVRFSQRSIGPSARIGLQNHTAKSPVPLEANHLSPPASKLWTRPAETARVQENPALRRGAARRSWDSRCRASISG